MCAKPTKIVGYDGLRKQRLLNDTLLDIARELETAMDALFGFKKELHILRCALDMDLAIISCIHGNHYQIMLADQEFDMVAGGSVFDAKNTYCHEVLARREMVTHYHVSSIKSMVLHPAYQALQLESYIGVPIFVGKHIYGTLNFSSLRPRKEFSYKHKLLVTHFADKISQAISREVDSIWNCG